MLSVKVAVLKRKMNLPANFYGETKLDIATEKHQSCSL